MAPFPLRASNLLAMPKFQPTRLVACAALLVAFAAQAQTHRVEAPEKVTRAIGVYEWTGDLAKPTAARLVPVSIFIDNAFQDGGTYYARPIPLAVLNGNIYSLEKSGVPQGNITLDYARHLQSTGTDDTAALGWFGYGTFAPLPIARKSAALRASAEPPAIVSSKDPDRPTFVRRNTSSPAATSSSGSKTSQPATTASNDPVDDPDRPHFSKPPTTSTPPPDPSDPKPASTTSTSPETKPADSSTASTSTRTRDDSKEPTDDTDRPTLRHRDPKQAEADRKTRSRSTVTAIGSPNDDPDRPNMRRGKTAGIGGDPSAQLTGIPTGLHQIVAVSDPTNREPHPFAREWATPTERADILAKLQIIAQQQLADYARTNGIAPPPPVAAKLPAKATTKPATRTATRTRHTTLAPASPAPITDPLSSEEISSYTLSYGGLPTFVYTAVSALAAASSSAPSLPERYVTLVAQQLPSGELQVAFSSVTDAAHLDRTPWFRLIDAVDPDAEHRASLLFELRGHTMRQFALYRILSARAEQLFVTNPTD
jgi:hypothetical protein